MPDRPRAIDPASAEIVEEVHAEYFRSLRGAPGLEIHDDPDVVWKVSPGAAWSNCAVHVRFSPKNCKKRLDEILARYNRNARGAGFWVGPAAEPADLEPVLKSRSLRCRKYFPAMYCDLKRKLPELQPGVPVEFSVVEDYGIFKRLPHPSLGRITTAIRRQGLECEKYLAACSPRTSWNLMASYKGEPVGICSLFIGKANAGLFDVGVLDGFRNRGIGRSLVRYACEFARERSARGAILIATNMGYNVYTHAGFREVARMGFWYTAHP